MAKSQKQNFLIDGFPRNKDNLDGWNKEMDNVARVQKVLFFNCPDKVCVYVHAYCERGWRRLTFNTLNVIDIIVMTWGRFKHNNKAKQNIETCM